MLIDQLIFGIERSYYSSWFCSYSKCYSLHGAVSDCQNTVNSALRVVDSCRDDVETAKDNIQQTEDRIENLKEENEVYSDRPSRAQLRYIDSVVAGVANREDQARRTLSHSSMVTA